MTRSARRGTTLVELLIALTMLGIVGTIVADAMRAQIGLRTRIARRAASNVQLREAVAPLAHDLVRVAGGGADVIAAESNDSILTIRSTRIEGWLCDADTARGHAWIQPASEELGRSPDAGDSLWVQVRTASSRPATRAVAVVVRAERRPAESGPCAVGATPWRVTIEGPARAHLAPGALARVRRRVRYSLYRASDRATYLGLREAGTSGSYATVQPVAGPFDPRRSRLVLLTPAGLERGMASDVAVGAVRLLLVERPASAWDDTAASARVDLTIALRRR